MRRGAATGGARSEVGPCAEAWLGIEKCAWVLGCDVGRNLCDLRDWLARGRRDHQILYYGRCEEFLPFVHLRSIE